MGINGTTRHWDVAQAPTPALKRLVSETPEQQFLRWRDFMRRAGASDFQIATQWADNQRKVVELQAYLASQGIRLIAKEGNIIEEGL